MVIDVFNVKKVVEEVPLEMKMQEIIMNGRKLMSEEAFIGQRRREGQTYAGDDHQH